MNILLACLSPPEYCPRARRFADLFSESHSVTLLSAGRYADDRVRNIPLVLRKSNLFQRLYLFSLLLLGRFSDYLKEKDYCSTVNDDYDVVICHDLILLPALLQRCVSARLILDAREYYPRQFESSLVWRFTFARLYNWICNNLLTQIYRGISVSQGIADLYAHRYGVIFDVIPSYPVFHELNPTPIDERAIRLVHHGVSNTNRALHLMVQAVDLLPENYSLDLYLVPADRPSYRRLCKLVMRAQRVRILKPVSPDEIVGVLNAYDIGLFVPPPSTINLKNSLPNKFFEFIQARLAVVVTPLSEVSKWIQQYDLGRISEDFSAGAIADALREISIEELICYKQRSHEQARQFSMFVLREKLDRLIGGEE